MNWYSVIVTILCTILLLSNVIILTTTTIPPQQIQIQQQQQQQPGLKEQEQQQGGPQVGQRGGQRGGGQRGGRGRGRGGLVDNRLKGIGLLFTLLKPFIHDIIGVQRNVNDDEEHKYGNKEVQSKHKYDSKEVQYNQGHKYGSKEVQYNQDDEFVLGMDEFEVCIGENFILPKIWNGVRIRSGNECQIIIIGTSFNSTVIENAFNRLLMGGLMVLITNDIHKEGFTYDRVFQSFRLVDPKDKHIQEYVQLMRNHWLEFIQEGKLVHLFESRGVTPLYNISIARKAKAHHVAVWDDFVRDRKNGDYTKGGSKECYAFLVRKKQHIINNQTFF